MPTKEYSRTSLHCTSKSGSLGLDDAGDHQVIEEIKMTLNIIAIDYVGCWPVSTLGQTTTCRGYGMLMKLLRWLIPEGKGESIGQRNNNSQLTCVRERVLYPKLDYAPESILTNDAKENRFAEEKPLARISIMTA